MESDNKMIHEKVMKKHNENFIKQLQRLLRINYKVTLRDLCDFVNLKNSTELVLNIVDKNRHLLCVDELELKITEEGIMKALEREGLSYKRKIIKHSFDTHMGGGFIRKDSKDVSLFIVNRKVTHHIVDGSLKNKYGSLKNKLRTVAGRIEDQWLNIEDESVDFDVEKEFNKVHIYELYKDNTLEDKLFKTLNQYFK